MSFAASAGAAPDRPAVLRYAGTALPPAVPTSRPAPTDPGPASGPAPAVTVQRAVPDPVPATPVQAIANGASPAVTAAPASQPKEPDLNELVDRLYPALADRLKAELRHDRERAGFLAGLS